MFSTKPSMLYAQLGTYLVIVTADTNSIEILYDVAHSFMIMYELYNPPQNFQSL